MNLRQGQNVCVGLRRGNAIYERLPQNRVPWYRGAQEDGLENQSSISSDPGVTGFK